MAMDALKNLTNNVPTWLTKLDDLSGQIEQRQAELAALDTPESKLAETRSLRNKGSTESLKPKDDGPAFISAPDAAPAAAAAAQPAEVAAAQPMKPSTPPQNAPKPSASPPSPGAGGLPATHKPPRDVVAAVNSRARAQVKKRVRSPSVMSGDGTPPTYRTRSMIIVYYDSEVQKFFDELVRFVSHSRNLMRKAKMAAKVAQIKKMAEVDVSSEGNANGDDGAEPLPSLRYMSTRRLGHMGGIARPGFGPPGVGGKPDVYDNLDKGLEFVQSTCEHGAHQFLRDADCNDEIKKIQNRLREVVDMAQKEAERVEREEPELAKETGELNKIRTTRQISVRRELSLPQKDATVATKDEAAKTTGALKPSHSKSSFIEPAAPLEVDTSMEADEGIDIDVEIPKLQYRSSRYGGGQIHPH
jgi:hypothetical protein